MTTKNLKINSYGKRGRSKTVLNGDEKEWLLCLYDLAGISRQTTGCKNVIYVSKVDAVPQYKQKQYLQRTLREILSIINGIEEIQIEDTFPENFPEECDDKPPKEVKCLVKNFFIWHDK